MIKDLLQNADIETQDAVASEFRKLKKMFKTMTKNQLIVLLLQQVEEAVHMKNINKLLIEQTKEKKESGDEK